MVGPPLKVSKQKGRKRQPEYREGPEARGNFEQTMKALFQKAKPISKKPKKGKD
jgi:hypothetical protein